MSLTSGGWDGLTCRNIHHMLSSFACGSQIHVGLITETFLIFFLEGVSARTEISLVCRTHSRLDVEISPHTEISKLATKVKFLSPWYYSNFIVLLEIKILIVHYHVPAILLRQWKFITDTRHSRLSCRFHCVLSFLIYFVITYSSSIVDSMIIYWRLWIQLFWTSKCILCLLLRNRCFTGLNGSIKFGILYHKGALPCYFLCNLHLQGLHCEACYLSHLVLFRCSDFEHCSFWRSKELFT